jgi:hypothetical protein
MINRKQVEHYLIEALKIVLVGSCVLLIPMAIVAFIATHWTLITQYDFALNPSGFETYLLAVGKYKALYAATVASAAAYFGLHRLHAATEANRQKEKQDRFTEWRTVLDIRMIETEKPDPKMKVIFTKLRYNLFCELYDMNFIMTDKASLERSFSIFRDYVAQMELFNEKYMQMGGVYRDSQHGYALDSFRYLLFNSADTVYVDAMQDLNQMYSAALPSGRNIDHATYVSSLDLFLRSGGRTI